MAVEEATDLEVGLEEVWVTAAVVVDVTVAVSVRTPLPCCLSLMLADSTCRLLSPRGGGLAVNGDEAVNAIRAMSAVRALSAMSAMRAMRAMRAMDCVDDVS